MENTIDINKQSSNQPYLLLILIALIFLGIGLTIGTFLFGRNNGKQVFNTAPIPTSTTQESLPPSQVPIPTTNILKEYKNSNFMYSFSYPQDLNLKESEDKKYIFLSSKPIAGFPDDEISYQVNVRNDITTEFNALVAAEEGADVPEVHRAVSVIVKKMNNTQIGNFSAVTYFRDGISSPEEKNRGPIGYSYSTLIKVKDGRYIEILTSSFDKEVIEQQKKIYDSIVESFKLI